MNKTIATAAVAFAAGQVFVVGLVIGLVWQGYNDDAFSGAVLLTMVVAFFAGPAAWLRLIALRNRWVWRGVQFALVGCGVGWATSAYYSAEGGPFAFPLLLGATVPVPFFHLFAEAAKHRTLAVAGGVAIAAAVIFSLPIARL